MSDTNCKACSRPLEPAEGLASEIDQALEATELALLKYQYTMDSPEHVSALYGVLRPLADRFLVRVAGVCSPKCRAAITSVVAALFMLMIGNGCASKADARNVPEVLPVPVTVLTLEGEHLHKIEAGETFPGIARIYGVSTRELLRRNHALPIYVGETIAVPAPVPESIFCQNAMESDHPMTDEIFEACL